MSAFLYFPQFPVIRLPLLPYFLSFTMFINLYLLLPLLQEEILPFVHQQIPLYVEIK